MQRTDRHVLPLLAVWVAVSLVALAGAQASDWPRFRGPNGTGICADSTPTPVVWSPTENLQWKTKLPGAGVSCPIVVGDRVFVTCYSGYGLDRRDPGEQSDLTRHLVCIDRQTGEIKWNQTVQAVLPEDPFNPPGVTEHGYASHTPASDGEAVYVFFGKTGALAFDLDGRQLWQTSLGTESDPHRWGSSSSPIVHEGKVIVTAGPESRSIVGLDARTGKELWQAEAEGLGNVWGTPAIDQVNDERSDLVIAAPFEIWGLNPETGKLRWYCEAIETDQFNSSVVIADGLILAIEGRGGGSIAIRSGGMGDVTESHVAWSGRDNNRFGTPVVYQGRLYFISNGIATCLDAKTGTRVYQARLPSGSESERAEGEDRGAQDEDRPRSQGRFGGRGFGRGGFGGSDYASPVIADGKIYYTRRSGEVHVLKTGDTFESCAVNRVTDDEEDFSATPAISDGQIFLRSNTSLYCVAAQ